MMELECEKYEDELHIAFTVWILYFSHIAWSHNRHLLWTKKGTFGYGVLYEFCEKFAIELIKTKSKNIRRLGVWDGLEF